MADGFDAKKFVELAMEGIKKLDYNPERAWKDRRNQYRAIEAVYQRFENGERFHSQKELWGAYLEEWNKADKEGAG